jgi:hypothetical protein
VIFRVMTYEDGGKAERVLVGAPLRGAWRVGGDAGVGVARATAGEGANQS